MGLDRQRMNLGLEVAAVFDVLTFSIHLHICEVMIFLQAAQIFLSERGQGLAYRLPRSVDVLNNEGGIEIVKQPVHED